MIFSTYSSPIITRLSRRKKTVALLALPLFLVFCQDRRFETVQPGDMTPPHSDRIDFGPGDMRPIPTDLAQAQPDESDTVDMAFTPDTTGCMDDSDCPAPLVCLDGQCQPECEETADCDAGLICYAQQCIEPECVTNEDCQPTVEICLDHSCQPVGCPYQSFQFDPLGEPYDSVHVAGDFNGWPQDIAGGGWPLEYFPELDLWFGIFEIENGRYEYKFVLNQSDWIVDPESPQTVDDGFGNENAVIWSACPTNAVDCGDISAFDWRDTVMYFAMVDRFFDSDGLADPVDEVSQEDAFTGSSGQYEGGDLAGVIQKSDYLVDLGVTALWITAPYENRNLAGDAITPESDPHTYSAYHGYWPSPDNISFSPAGEPTPTPLVEPRIGDAETLHQLVDTFHRADSASGHGVRILFDYVMNHVDRESALYLNHPDWFVPDGDSGPVLCGPDNLWDDPYWGTRCAFTDYLPAFDFVNDEARLWSIQDALWWAREFQLDGYRLDAIKHVPVEWLEDLRSALNDSLVPPLGERFYLVGETFNYDDKEALARFINPQTQLDGQFDFPLKAQLCEAFYSEWGQLDTLAEWVADNDPFYGPESIMTTWIGNHDIPRTVHFANREITNCREGSHSGNSWTSLYSQPTDPAAYERMALSYAFLFTSPGVPLIYYGDEIGLAGGGDPDNRRMMPWDDSTLLPEQITLRETVSQLAWIRAVHPALTRGERLTWYADDVVWAYTMTGCGEATSDLSVLFNRDDNVHLIQLPHGTYLDLLSGDTVSGGPAAIQPRSFRLLEHL